MIISTFILYGSNLLTTPKHPAVIQPASATVAFASPTPGKAITEQRCLLTKERFIEVFGEERS